MTVSIPPLVRIFRAAAFVTARKTPTDGDDSDKPREMNSFPHHGAISDKLECPEAQLAVACEPTMLLSERKETDELFRGLVVVQFRFFADR
jgi:hypothetical protein